MCTLICMSIHSNIVLIVPFERVKREKEKKKERQRENKNKLNSKNHQMDRYISLQVKMGKRERRGRTNINRKRKRKTKGLTTKNRGPAHRMVQLNISSISYYKCCCVVNILTTLYDNAVSRTIWDAQLLFIQFISTHEKKKRGGKMEGKAVLLKHLIHPSIHSHTCTTTLCIQSQDSCSYPQDKKRFGRRSRDS